VKASQFKTFVETFLEELGGEFLRREAQFVEVKLPDKVALDWPTRHLRLAFSPKAQGTAPDTELLSVGHPLLDRILDLCRSQGRFSKRFEPVPKKRGRRPTLGSAPDLEEGWEWGEPVEAYRPLVCLAFVINVSTMEAPDELETLLLDPWTGEHLGEGAGEIRAWSEETEEPAAGRRVLPLPDMDVVLKWGLALLDGKIHKRVARVKGRHRGELQGEVENIETYYRQMIEELRNGSRRDHLTAAEREEKIRVLQLDWKRRIQEATEYLRPRITVRLSAVGILYRPCWALPALGAKGRPKGDGAKNWVVAGHGATQWKPPQCTGCHGVAKGGVIPTPEAFHCVSCSVALESGTI